ncbi:PASTA domain-containing protein [Microbacterium sp. B2969]|uniref:PASTA domain-containing protein n=1 Tax=Microbacterium alkaliflavum TaxID=3248839 RepID=A0ABW7QD60_9MICO
MDEEGGSEFGPAVPVSPSAAPFSVSGPSVVSLDATRQGVTSFVVANTTGRPVTARLLVQPVDGADASWFTLDGPIDRPMAVAATLSANVKIAVPEKAPAGEHGIRLDVAVEDSPDRVASGPNAVFSVPAPKKRRFPWWIVAVVVGALVLIGGGIALILFLTAPKDPVLKTAPQIDGTAEIGQTLTAVDATWDPADVVRVRVWQECPADADPDNPAGCQDITVANGSDSATAVGQTFVVGSEQEGLRLRVVEVAFNVDQQKFSDTPADKLDSLPRASAASSLSDVVPPAPPQTATVPDLDDQPLSAAQDALAAVGLQALVTRAGTAATCTARVTDQNPNPGQVVPVGSAVAITAGNLPPGCLKIDIDPGIIKELPFDITDLIGP